MKTIISGTFQLQAFNQKLQSHLEVKDGHFNRVNFTIQ